MIDGAVAVVCADVVMQDDGARSERFAPTFGNTGLFFVRCNDKTKHLLQVGGQRQSNKIELTTWPTDYEVILTLCLTWWWC